MPELTLKDVTPQVEIVFKKLAASGFKTLSLIFVLHFDTFPKTFRQLCIY